MGIGCAADIARDAVWVVMAIRHHDQENRYQHRRQDERQHEEEYEQEDPEGHSAASTCWFVTFFMRAVHRVVRVGREAAT